VIGGLLGLGIDAVDVGRFRGVLARRPGLAGRLFTAGEQAYAARQGDPAPSLAARFAAKEAAMKALGVGIGAFRFTDVEVVRLPGGQPALEVRGAARALADQQGVGKFLVSLSHTSSQAEAVVAAIA
jgi:holo-[acyl-carrier protein] synthase